MTAITDCETDSTDCVEWPDYDLEYKFDDEEDPESVTVFEPEEEAKLTAWITMDVDHAASVAEAR